MDYQAGTRCAVIENLSPVTGKIELHGPESGKIVSSYFPGRETAELEYLQCISSRTEGIPVMLARSGQAGEDGYEIFTLGGDIRTIWKALLSENRFSTLRPAGYEAKRIACLEAGAPFFDYVETANPAGSTGSTGSTHLAGKLSFRLRVFVKTSWNR